MHKIVIVGSAVLLAISGIASAADTNKKAGGGNDGAKSALEKHGLAEFDLNGDGKLDQSERAAAVVAKRAAQKEAAKAAAQARAASGPYYAASNQMMLHAHRGHHMHTFNPAHYQNFPTGADYATQKVGANLQGPMTVDIGYCPKSKQDETLTFTAGPPASMPAFGN
jgi:hypothetical protein